MAVTSGAATAQAQGITNFAHGTFTGAGLVAEINCGFRPRYVKLINITDRIVDERVSGMTVGNTLHTVAAGTMTEATASAIVLKGGGTDAYRGFEVAAATAISAKVFHWVAFG